MNIQCTPIQEINPAAYNPRVDLKPGDPAYDALHRSVDEFGLVEPLVWNKQTGNLVGGHQRLKVLIARGETEVETVVVDLPPEKEKALNLALNKIHGDWDEQKLAELLDELIQTPEFDIALTGFEEIEATDLIAEILGDVDGQRDEQFDINAALAAGGEPVTQLGDVIVLGVHRLMCGDSTSTADIRRLMDGQRASLFATDPPYLVGYDGTNHPGSKRKKQKKTSKLQASNGNAVDSDEGRKDWSGSYGVTWDDADANPDLYKKFIAAAVAEAITDNAAWYCWHASRNQAMLEQAWNESGAFVHCQIIWVKNRGVPTRTWYLWQHEPCLMGWIKGNMPQRVQQKRISTVWELDTLPNNAERPDHPTPKPLEVFEIPMRQHTRAGDICYEPFAGSGTQIIAAERLKRHCFAMEISPQYCDLIVRRFIAFAGEGTVDPAVAERYRLPETTSTEVSA